MLNLLPILKHQGFKYSSNFKLPIDWKRCNKDNSWTPESTERILQRIHDSCKEINIKTWGKNGL